MNSNPHADDDRLSGYLTGELSDDEVRELERRCAADPAIAARLDALHDALWTLRRLDRVEPPAGYLDRLRDRLDREREALGAAAAAPGRPVSRLRPRRAGLRPRVGWAVGAAAGLAAAALIAGGVVRGLGGGAEQDIVAGQAAPEAGEASRALQDQVDDGVAAPGPGDLGVERGAFDDGAGPAAGGTPPTLADETAVRTRYAGNAAARALLGTPRPGGNRASEPGADVRPAPDAPSPEPSCAAAIGGTTAAQAVTVAVESVVYRGSPRLALVVVDASPGSAVLDRIAVVMVDPASCAIRERVDLTAAGE
jgi:anti-sigma factor RsiW